MPTKGRKRVEDKNRKNRAVATNMKVTNMVDINPTISIINLNVNGLNSPTEEKNW